MAWLSIYRRRDNVLIESFLFRIDMNANSAEGAPHCFYRSGCMAANLNNNWRYRPPCSKLDSSLNSFVSLLIKKSRWISNFWLFSRSSVEGTDSDGCSQCKDPCFSGFWNRDIEFIGTSMTSLSIDRGLHSFSWFFFSTWFIEVLSTGPVHLVQSSSLIMGQPTIESCQCVVYLCICNSIKLNVLITPSSSTSLDRLAQIYMPKHR